MYDKTSRPVLESSCKCDGLILKYKLFTAYLFPIYVLFIDIDLDILKGTECELKLLNPSDIWSFFLCVTSSV